jgi:hypothetical protein
MAMDVAQISWVLTECLPLTVLSVAPAHLGVINIVLKRAGHREIRYGEIHRVLASCPEFWVSPRGKKVRAELRRSDAYRVWAELPALDKARIMDMVRALVALEIHRFLASLDSTKRPDSTALAVMNLVLEAQGKPTFADQEREKLLSAFWESCTGQRLQPLIGSSFWNTWETRARLLLNNATCPIYMAVAIQGILEMMDALLPEERQVGWRVNRDPPDGII